MQRRKKAALITASMAAQLYWLVSIILVIVVAALYLSSQPATTPPASVQQVQEQVKPATKEEILKLVNEERAKVGVAPLTIEPKLEQSAQWKADRMTATGNYTHKDPATGKKDGLDYLKSLKPGCVYVSENLEWEVTDRDSSFIIVDSWVQSKPHYDAMVDPKYSLTGFGISNGSVVEHFCQK